MAGNKSGSKGGQTSSGAAKAGAKERPAATSSRSATGAKSYKDTASGKTHASPKFGGASIKGLTSKDPANVARNRAGAANYSSMKDRIAASGRDGNADKAAAQAAYRAASAVVRRNPTVPVQAAVAAPTAAPVATMATKPPVGYRPGIDPEYNYRAGAPTAMAPRPAVTATATPFTRPKPTITLAKGGKAPRKKK